MWLVHVKILDGVEKKKTTTTTTTTTNKSKAFVELQEIS